MISPRTVVVQHSTLSTKIVIERDFINFLPAKMDMAKRIELEKRGRKSSEVFILYLLFNIYLSVKGIIETLFTRKASGTHVLAFIIEYERMGLLNRIVSLQKVKLCVPE